MLVQVASSTSDSNTTILSVCHPACTYYYSMHEELFEACTVYIFYTKMFVFLSQKLFDQNNNNYDIDSFSTRI